MSSISEQRGASRVQLRRPAIIKPSPPLSRSERRRQWVTTGLAMLPSLVLFLQSSLMLVIFGARLPFRWLHLLGPLSASAFHEAARVAFGSFVLALVVAIIWGWRTAANDARRAMAVRGVGR